INERPHGDHGKRKRAVGADDAADESGNVENEIEPNDREQNVTRAPPPLIPRRTQVAASVAPRVIGENYGERKTVAVDDLNDEREDAHQRETGGCGKPVSEIRDSQADAGSNERV